MRVPSGQGTAFAMQAANTLNVPGFQVDSTYDPVPVSATPTHAPQLAAANEEAVIVRGTIDESRIPDLEAQPNVLKVWRDTRIAPCSATPVTPSTTMATWVQPTAGTGVCPIPPCDCDPGT